ncbi:hypothetical protein OH77DRAFT_940497 [Trametes cingulata]|nr:hypothetical protein OH77DRAFT_940497 [Trametes cingulata]
MPESVHPKATLCRLFRVSGFTAGEGWSRKLKPAFDLRCLAVSVDRMSPASKTRLRKQFRRASRRENCDLVSSAGNSSLSAAVPLHMRSYPGVWRCEMPSHTGVSYLRQSQCRVRIVSDGAGCSSWRGLKETDRDHL